MIESKLSQLILKELNVLPTKGQERAIALIAEFLYSNKPYALFILKGFAGTGKTSLISALVKCLSLFKVDVQLLAPTGRAAKVLASYSDASSYTIHKKIYRQQSSSDGFGRFVLDFNKHSNTLFIVDEASMVSNELSDGSVFGSGRLLEDLLEFVYQGHNCRLMLVGDTAQLPPVGLETSPALEPDFLNYHGFTVFHTELTEVVRQEGQSGILYNATKIRDLVSKSNVGGNFQVRIKPFNDVEFVSGEFLIEKISDCYDRYGMDETIVVTRSNKRANLFNQGIRRSILYREEELAAGDLLMVVKNNYFYVNPEEKLDFIANGEIGKVIRVGKTENLYGFRYANVCLQLLDLGNLEIDCKVFLDTLNIEKPAFGSEDGIRLFEAIGEDYQDVKNKKKRLEMIRKNEYYNALQVKYAYAVTCHKAQGGQWEAVFIDHGYLAEEMINTDFLRWLYTAFTRPKTKLFLVNFDKRFRIEV